MGFCEIFQWALEHGCNATISVSPMVNSIIVTVQKRGYVRSTHIELDNLVSAKFDIVEYTLNYLLDQLDETIAKSQ